MGPHYKVSSSASSVNSVKPTIKFLATCRDPRLQRMILQSSTDSVYKAICNAFFNVAENPDISLSSRHKRIFKKHRNFIQKIISPKIKLQQKKRLIQRGGHPILAAILPSILSTAIGVLGSAFLNRQLSS
jgi:hypothetical protein